MATKSSAEMKSMDVSSGEFPGSQATVSEAPPATNVLQKLMGPLLYGSVHAAVLNITAIIGVGILTLPNAMAHLNWSGGILFLFISWASTGFSLWQLVEMYELEKVDHEGLPVRDENGKVIMIPYRKYQLLAERAFGKKWSSVVAVMQLVVFVGVCIVYMVAGGYCLLNAYKLLCHHRRMGDLGKCEPFGLSAWIVVFSSLQFVLSPLIPDLTRVTFVSFIATLMTVSYSFIITATMFEPSPSPSYPRAPGPAQPPSQCEKMDFDPLSSFAALGFIAFAYAGHNVVLEIQHSIPTSSQMPSNKLPMLWGIGATYVVVGICYFAMAISGYIKLGHLAASNVLGDLGYLGCQKKGYGNPHHLTSLADLKPGLAAAANIMVALHLSGTYQIFAMPVYTLLEGDLKQEFVVFTKWGRPSNTYKEHSYTVAVRWSFVASTLLIAVAIPDFDSLLGIFGGLLFAPTTYFLPCLMWLKIKQPKPLSFMWMVNWANIVLGVVLMILSFIGNIHVFSERVRSYKHWAFH